MLLRQVVRKRGWNDWQQQRARLLCSSSIVQKIHRLISSIRKSNCVYFFFLLFSLSLSLSFPRALSLAYPHSDATRFATADCCCVYNNKTRVSPCSISISATSATTTSGGEQGYREEITWCRRYFIYYLLPAHTKDTIIREDALSNNLRIL